MNLNEVRRSRNAHGMFWDKQTKEGSLQNVKGTVQNSGLPIILMMERETERWRVRGEPFGLDISEVQNAETSLTDMSLGS